MNDRKRTSHCSNRSCHRSSSDAGSWVIGVAAYRECLYFDLIQSGLYVEKEKPIPIVYKDVKLDHGYRIDLLVENKLVLELKTVEFFTDVHTAQVLTYLRLGNYKLGLLINFHVRLLRDGIKRIIN